MPSIRNSLVLLCLILALAATPALAADGPPVGEYRVSGSDADGGGKYEGTLLLTRTGDIYTFEGLVDGQDYQGTGLYDRPSQVLGLFFQGADQDEQGLTVLRWNGTILKGRWIYLNNPEGDLGTEEWTPVK